MSSGSGAGCEFRGTVGQGCAFVAGLITSIPSGLLLVYMYCFTPMDPDTPNYDWVKFTSLFIRPEGLILIIGFVFGTALMVLGILLPRQRHAPK